jgi:hypothetical protein
MHHCIPRICSLLHLHPHVLRIVRLSACFSHFKHHRMFRPGVIYYFFALCPTPNPAYIILVFASFF